MQMNKQGETIERYTKSEKGGEGRMVGNTPNERRGNLHRALSLTRALRQTELVVTLVVFSPSVQRTAFRVRQPQ